MLSPLLFLLACPQHPAPQSDPASVVAAASTPVPDVAVVSRFDMNLATPSVRGPASGTLLIDPPNRFYLEIRPPVGSPALVAASDGQTVSAYVASKHTFYTHASADVALSSLTGGLANLSTVVRLLSGRLPELGSPNSINVGLSGIEGQWTGPANTRLNASFDPKTARLTFLRGFDPQGVPVVELTYVPGKVYPTQLNAVIPKLQAQVDIHFGKWENADVPDTIYHIAAPAGTAVMDLSVLSPAAP